LVGVLEERDLPWFECDLSRISERPVSPGKRYAGERSEIDRRRTKERNAKRKVWRLR